MNDCFDLRIITQPHSQVYWGYFRRLVFGNSSTKHNKLTYFSNSMLFCSDVLLPFSHIPRCIHAKTPDFPRLFEPRASGSQTSRQPNRATLRRPIRELAQPEHVMSADFMYATRNPTCPHANPSDRCHSVQVIFSISFRREVDT